MNNKHYVGGAVSRFQDLGILPSVSQVKLFVDDDTYFVAPTNGDDSGYTIEAFCPSATQAMANSVLAQLQSCKYQGYKASSATISPDAELGDGVDVRGVYGMIARQDLHFGATHTADLEAPSEDLYNKKYPFVSETRKNLSRNDRKVSSLIQQSSDQIRFEVFGEDGYTGSSIVTQLDSISQQVKGKVDGATVDNKIAVALDSITISSSTSGVSGNNSCSITLRGKSGDVDIVATGIITMGNVVANSVSASNISGKISSDQIKLYGDLTVFKTSGSSAPGGSLGYTPSTVDGAGIHMESSGSEVRVTAFGAAVEGSGGGRVVCTGDTSITGDYIYFNAGDGCYIASNHFSCKNDWGMNLGYSGVRWGNIYCGKLNEGSDRALKTDIEYGLDKYDAFFDKLKPCSYKFIREGKDGKTNTGLIAQDVDEALSEAGFDRQDFEGLAMSEQEGASGLVYNQFIALLINQVQKLKKRDAERDDYEKELELRLQKVEETLGLNKL